EAGRQAFQAGHIPGAVHLDMDRDLSGSPGEGGRHPLPSPAAFSETMSRAGVGADTLVVAYDDGDGMGSARLWWLLRHFGHERVAILDGGLPAWLAGGQPLESGPGDHPERQAFATSARADDFIDADELRRKLDEGKVLVLDARGPERWRGDMEPVDAQPGRIPGSINAPAGENVAGGRFRSPDELRRYYESLGVGPTVEVVLSCGSGVSACVDLVGLELAGFHRAKLYPGSYSGWLARGFPIQRG
ncbi:MAG: sulfurtransferase, partial [Chloroflexota bacterium]|nr:sulfurtransferase [Chloroflexota bacterium]